MSTTQFTELLTQAGRLDQNFSGVFASAENERVKACEELVSALDKRIVAANNGRKKIAYYTLYAPTSSPSIVHRQLIS